MSYRVSIVTAVLNGALNIERNVRSVLSQTYDAKEHIIIDGGSTDGTLDILRKFSEEGRNWRSEPDQGLADAMNKGIGWASGDLVVFLHADDYFPSRDSLSTAMSYVNDLEVVWSFDVLFGKPNRLLRLKPRPFDWRVWFKNPLPHQGVLTPKHLFGKFGNFDIGFRICMDYEFWIRLYSEGVKLRRVDEVLAVMEDEGVSSRRDWEGLRARFMEERLVHMRHKDSTRLRFLYPAYWPTYLAYRWLRTNLAGG